MWNFSLVTNVYHETTFYNYSMLISKSVQYKKKIFYSLTPYTLTCMTFMCVLKEILFIDSVLFVQRKQFCMQTKKTYSIKVLTKKYFIPKMSEARLEIFP